MQHQRNHRTFQRGPPGCSVCFQKEWRIHLHHVKICWRSIDIMMFRTFRCPKSRSVIPNIHSSVRNSLLDILQWDRMTVGHSSEPHILHEYDIDSMCVLQQTADFSLITGESGQIVTEDGRSRCPFNPEYKSTAIIAGRADKHCKLLKMTWQPLQ